MKLTDDQLIDLYVKHKSRKKVSNLSGRQIGDKRLKRLLRSRGFATDKQFSRSCRTDIPTYREQFPEDDKKLGYICGLIASDGCLQKGKKILSIELQDLDRKTVEFVASTCVQNPVYLKSHQRQFRPTASPTVGFSANLPKLYQYCLDMGITPNKSLTLNVNLDDKSDEFKWYFLRGVIDGDGCVSVGPRLTDSTIRISSASLKFIQYLQTIFGGFIGLYKTPKNPSYHLCFKGIACQQLLTKLPLDEFTMQRKTDRLLIISSKIPCAIRLSSELVGSIWGVKEKKLNMKELWNQPGVSVSYETIKWRIYQGWSQEDAVFAPKGTRRSSLT